MGVIPEGVRKRKGEGKSLAPRESRRHRRSRPKTSGLRDRSTENRSREAAIEDGKPPDGFGRVGGIQPGLLKDRCPAFGSAAADELNPIGRPGRGLGYDPHELVERVDVFERFAPRLGPIFGSREVGFGAIRVEVSSPTALARSCARRRERSGSTPAPSRRYSLRAPGAGPPNRRRRRGR